MIYNQNICLVKGIQIQKVSRKKMYYLPPISTPIVWPQHCFTHSKFQRFFGFRYLVIVSSDFEFWIFSSEQSGFCLHFLTEQATTERAVSSLLRGWLKLKPQFSANITVSKCWAVSFHQQRRKVKKIFKKWLKTKS